MEANVVNKKEQNEFIGVKIREYRKKNRLTQSALAERIGIKDNTISAYERGVVDIPHSKLIAVANALKVKYTELLPIEEDSEETVNDFVMDAEMKLTDKQFAFFEAMLEKALSLNDQERKNFMENVRFTIEFFNKGK